MNLNMIVDSKDAVLISVFFMLIGMSLITWTIIIVRAIRLLVARRANRVIQQSVWTLPDLDSAAVTAKQHPAPIGDLILASLAALQKYQDGSHQGLSQALPLNDYLVRNIRNNITQILRRFDGGLTALASIGATAPFIGLFGTVWGIYHALINISHTGQVSIAVVSAPIGEALIATAAGLFVAIPAVLAYNTLIRANKTLAQDLDAFAYDWHVQLLNVKE